VILCHDFIRLKDIKVNGICTTHVNGISILPIDYPPTKIAHSKEDNSDSNNESIPLVNKILKLDGSFPFQLIGVNDMKLFYFVI